MAFLKPEISYKLPNGGMTQNKAEAVASHLIQITDGGSWEPDLSLKSALKIVEERQQVIALLQEMDAPPEEPAS
jgi:hypothetical protein